jgi:hypothetical protein
VVGRKARFVQARGAGAWLSASPRVQTLVAAHVAVVLGAGLLAVAIHQRPDVRGEPLALAAATGPASPPVELASASAPRLTKAPARPAATKQRAKPARRQSAPPPPRGWAYWSARIRGCESHGRPDAPPDYQAQNPQSSASGAYQILDTTWAGRYGVSHASDATPSQQEAAAADLYRRHGKADWMASAPCWRSG